jgi:hypothetical protein
MAQFSRECFIAFFLGGVKESFKGGGGKFFINFSHATK